MPLHILRYATLAADIIDIIADIDAIPLLLMIHIIIDIIHD
jgi:hypothetical protein